MFNCFSKLVTCIFIIVLAVSCRKEHQLFEPPPPEGDYHLINSGFLLNPQTNFHEPHYWIDDSIHALPFNDALQAYAYGIESNNNSLYFAGYYTPKSALPGIDALPCYWKDNVKYNLPTKESWSFSICTARDIKVWNGKTYIIGHYDHHQVIWIVEPGGNVNIIEVAPEPNTLEGSLRATGNFVIENNTLYIGGVQAREVNGRKEVEVGYWTLAANHNLAWHRTTGHLAYALAFAIAVSDTKVYLTGEYSTDFTGTSPAKMVLWDGSEEMNLTPVSNPPALRLSELKFDEQGYLHTNLYDFEHHRPLIFKISKAGNVQAINPMIPSGVRGYTNNVALMQGKAAYSGYYYAPNGRVMLWSWINGEIRTLEVPEKFSFATLTSSKWVSLKRRQ